MKSWYLVKPYFIERRRLIASGILCLMMVDILQLFIPRIIKAAVDDLTIRQVTPGRLAVYAGDIVLIAVCTAILRYIWRRFLIGTSRVVEEKLRNRIFFHVQTLSPAYFDTVKTGDLMAHATNDINNVRMAVGMGMVALTDAVFLGSAAIAFMAYINVELTLYTLIPMPVIIFMTRIFGKKMHLRYTVVQKTFSDMTEAVRESFSGIKIVKAFNREEGEYRRLNSVSSDYIGKNIDLVRITGSFFPLMLLMTNISQTIVLFWGGRETILTRITPGDFVAFISYLNLLMWPMMALGWVTNLIQRGSASLDRIDKILTTRPAIADLPGALPLKGVRGDIEFKDVRFAYSESRPAAVLKDIRLSIPAGSTLGIVGPQGSGKTSLLNLIPRLRDTGKGKITLDGRDIKSLRLNDLRASIALVSQEPYLFSGTIRENITFGAEGDEKDLIAAAGAAALYDTILQFPKGFDTLVGERGVVLSGGQKQRIILARALMRDTPVVLLDDPVGQVDSETAAAIIETIRKLSADRTVIIVSHRLSAVMFADRIIVLDDGRIAASGTHDELMEKSPYYAQTFMLQSLIDV